MPLAFRMGELEIKVPAYLQHEFVDLEQGDVFANAGPRTSAKLER